jgi:hypothetical protein
MATSAFKQSVNTVQKSVAPALTAKPEPQAVKSGGAEVRGIMAYPSIETPDERSGGKYNALLYVTDPEDQAVLAEMVADACEETFRTRTLPPGAHNPLRDCNEKTPSGEYAFKHPIFRTPGGIVLRAKTSYQPQCVWGPNETEISPSEINGGDEVIVTLSTYGYNNQSAGVAFSLGRIWLISKGEVRVERGSGAGANVRRIDRSKIRFTNPQTGEAA